MLYNYILYSQYSFKYNYTVPNIYYIYYRNSRMKYEKEALLKVKMAENSI